MTDRLRDNPFHPFADLVKDDLSAPTGCELLLREDSLSLGRLGYKQSSVLHDTKREAVEAGEKLIKQEDGSLSEGTEIRYGETEMSVFSRELQRLTGLRPVISDPDSEFTEEASEWIVDLFAPKGAIYLGYFTLTVYPPRAKTGITWSVRSFANEGTKELRAAIEQAARKAFKTLMKW